MRTSVDKTRVRQQLENSIPEELTAVGDMRVVPKELTLVDEMKADSACGTYFNWRDESR